MKTLILNVDRDDDLGRKAKVKTPIIGVANNIEAANKLGQTDPEDSDLNAIFSAISTYNSLRDENKDVEIATICGDINVGLKSDQKIAEELEIVINKTGVDGIILITDGAEDEYILPIIQSRIKINSIKRVTVKQSRELEDTYYRVMRILEDEKVQKQFFLPIALVLIVWAIFVLLDMVAYGLGAILFTLGTYILIRVFRWERSIAAISEEIKSGLLTGKLSFYTYIIAIVVIGVTIFFAYQSTIEEYIPEFWAVPVLLFFKNVIWGIIFAGLIAASGRVVDYYVREEKIHWQYWIIPFSFLAFGFISSAVFGSLYESLFNWPYSFSTDPFKTGRFVLNTSTGVLIALVGAVTYHYIKEMYILKDKEIEIDNQTKITIEES